MAVAYLQTSTKTVFSLSPQLSAERNDLFELAERRQLEVERLHGEWQTLSRQLAEANEEKCRALVAAEDVKSAEVSLQYRERRMEEEREYLNGQVRALTEELARKNEEVMAARDLPNTVPFLDSFVYRDFESNKD